ncbi:cytochrome P450 2K6-like [Erpetoichthys calabaricus]|uniref:cytochrome P450 2K6-like n=1 Tax=Erpetoichthys calabaricus TaxID=27687 RepID=UPI002233E527|nr:cytochrome P450 2K6-like [Erpetoichthys calabaricus]
MLSSFSELLGDTITSYLLCFLVFIIFCCFLLTSSKDSKYSFPPGPRPLPLIGNLNILDRKLPKKTLIQLSEKYGNMYTFHLGPEKHLILCGYKTVKEALVERADEFGERGETVWHNEVTRGNGIVFGKGESWKAMRRFAISTLKNFGMGRVSLEEQIVEECQKMMEVFESYKGQAFSPNNILKFSTSNIIFIIVLGRRFDYEDSDLHRLQKHLNEYHRFLGSPQLQLYNMYPFLGFLLSDLKRAAENITEFRKYFNIVYYDHKDKVDKNDLRSFTDAFLLKQQMEDTYFNETNFEIVAINLFAAGTETTAITLAWGLLLMMRYPDIQAKVRQEIENVIGNERCPRYEDKKNMPYTNAVLHEIQRFGDVAPLNLLHQTSQDTTFQGYKIPKGTKVIPLLSSVLFDKTQWATPFEFNPAHFLDADGKFVKKDAFMPFSAGRRACLGETLAMMELFLYFTLLMQKFKFHPAPGVAVDQLDMSPSPGFTASPQPFQLCAEIH